MIPLAQWSPTLAGYTPLNCGVARISAHCFIVIFEGMFHDDERHDTRIGAVLHLARLAREHEERVGKRMEAAL